MSLTLIHKTKKRAWAKIVAFTRNMDIYHYLYKSYWYSKLYNKNRKPSNTIHYFSASPNYGAGIGHQMANWIAGYWFAKQFNLKFAHIPFSSKKWEAFLGFGINEPLVGNLKNEGFKVVKLPLFEETNEYEVQLIKKIIKSYSDKRIVFVAEQDQYYQDQFGVIEEIQHKFYNNPERAADKLIYDPACYNIAVHVRRGDIVIGQENGNANLQMRYQGNEYFIKVLRSALLELKTGKSVAIYIFSQGKKEDYPEFAEFDNVHFCLDMGAQDSFLHMVFADLLITSKSSFSYKPALLNRKMKISPVNFWHGYPKISSWKLADDNGIVL